MCIFSGLILKYWKCYQIQQLEICSLGGKIIKLMSFANEQQNKTKFKQQLKASNFLPNEV